jgi:hypothetical protein
VRAWAWAARNTRYRALGQGCAMMEACVGEGVGMGSVRYTLPGTWARLCNYEVVKKTGQYNHAFELQKMVLV